MSVTEAAEKLGISRQTLHGILAEKHAVTPEMAARLSSAAMYRKYGCGCSRRMICGRPSASSRMP